MEEECVTVDDVAFIIFAAKVKSIHTTFLQMLIFLNSEPFVRERKKIRWLMFFTKTGAQSGTL